MRVLISGSSRGLSLAVGVLIGAVVLALAPAVADQHESAPITEAEVKAAQQAWCDALVKIGKVYQEGGDYRAVASQVIDDLYDYQEGKVFFKPTLASGKNTFRPTKEGALSYFVGGDQNFPEDSGFALRPWTEVTYKNNAAARSMATWPSRWATST